jgi:uncharacterized protein (UPF0332 family)
MKLSSEDKKNLSSIRFEKSEEFLRDARANLEESRCKTAVNRAYYAALNAVRALLILDGVDPDTHSGAVTTLSLHFVKTGLLSVDVIKTFKLLLSRRTDVDYGDFEIIDAEDAEDSVQKAQDIIQKIDALRRSLAADM